MASTEEIIRALAIGRQLDGLQARPDAEAEAQHLHAQYFYSESRVQALLANVPQGEALGLGARYSSADIAEAMRRSRNRRAK